MSQAFFVSDIHIKTPEESNSEKLLLFLHGLENNGATHLFLVGDIFDLWIDHHSYFVDRYKKIVNAIRSLVNKGIEVHYFEGNHDLYLKSFWQQDVGVQVHDGPEFFNIDGQVVRVEHGDLMNPDDRGYLFLKKTLQSSPIKQLAKNLPSPIVRWVGERASQASRHYTSHQKSIEEEKAISFMHTYAQNEVQKRHFDFLITGHTHVRDIYQFSNQGQEVFSINLGSWFDDQRVGYLKNGEFIFIEVE